MRTVNIMTFIGVRNFLGDTIELVKVSEFGFFKPSLGYFFCARAQFFMF